MKGSKTVEENAEYPLKLLFTGVIPEREKEMKEYLIAYAPYFSRCDDRPGFIVEAGAFGILKFTYRTMLLMWLLGFAAKQSLVSYSTLIAKVRIYGKRFSSREADIIPDQENEHQEYKVLIDSIYELAAATDLNSFSWPNNVPHPENGKPKDNDGAAIFDLNCMATAYVFLHEMKHIAFSSDATTAINPIAEELECDCFAQEMMLDKLADYSTSSGYPLDRLKSKRAMSLALASFYMLVITPINLWGGSDSHPSLASRIESIVNKLQIPSDDIFWIFASSLYLSHLRYIGCDSIEIEFDNLRELSLSLINIIENKAKS